MGRLVVAVAVLQLCTCPVAPLVAKGPLRRARAAPRSGDGALTFARRRGEVTSWSPEGSAQEREPRLASVAARVVGLAFQVALGCGPGDVNAVVRARSNLDVLRGRLSLVSVDFGACSGFLCRFRDGSILGRDLDLGLGPLACLAAPLACLAFRPNVFFALFGLYALRRSRGLRRLFAGRPCKVEFSCKLSSDDLAASRALRPFLRQILETLVTSSPLSQFPTPLTDGSTRFELRKASLEGDKLLLDAVAAFGGARSPPADGAPENDAAAIVVPPSRQAFVLRTTVAPSSRQGDALEFLNPELHASFDDWTRPLGLKLPDVWIPLVSGVGVPLGPHNRVQEATIDRGSCSLRGSINLNGYETRGDTATLVRAPPRR